MRGFTATDKDGNCDLVKLCETYLKVGNIPEKFSFGRASELALLARTVLPLLKDPKLFRKREDSK